MDRDIFGIEDATGTPFLVMDYAPHGTVRKRHPRGTQVPLTTIVPYVKQVASALHYAHEEHLVHRDVKPENMLISQQQGLLLSDFGVSVVFQTGRTTGSTTPQQTRGGILLQTYTGHAYSANTVAWSPNGTAMASGSDDNTVQVWEATTGRLLHIYKRHSSVVYSVAWSPDGTSIASGSDDNTVQIWDVSTGRLLHIYKGHTNGVYAVAWSPDGTRIASGSWDKTVQVWQAR